MKEIMSNMKPQQVEKILNGETLIDIRKNKPKSKPPFKVYIYCQDAILPKVVAEFTLNNITLINADLKSLYAWHIDNLKIYDEPKNIDDFYVGKVALDCGYGNYNIYNKKLQTPPKNYCYVETTE